MTEDMADSQEEDSSGPPTMVSDYSTDDADDTRSRTSRADESSDNDSMDLLDRLVEV